MKTGKKKEKVSKKPQKRTNCISLEQLEEEIKEPRKLIMALLDYGIVKKPICGCGANKVKIVNYRGNLTAREAG